MLKPGSSSTSACDCIWRQRFHKGAKVKMRLVLTLAQSDLCPQEKGEFGHAERHLGCTCRGKMQQKGLLASLEYSQRTLICRHLNLGLSIWNCEKIHVCCLSYSMNDILS
jgi:hypothetical protein